MRKGAMGQDGSPAVVRLRYHHAMPIRRNIRARSGKRVGDRLRIGREEAAFGRNAVAPTGSGYVLQSRFFVNDPWALIAEAIARSPPGRPRDIAQSFRRQAEDYFRAASVVQDVAVRPVLLYYAFLNLSKAFAIVRGNTKLADPAQHGISQAAKPRTIPGALIRFQKSSAKRPSVFDELLRLLDGNAAVLDTELRLGHLLPQILPGHRPWCYATNRIERFIPIHFFEILHSTIDKQIWLNIFVERGELTRTRLGISEEQAFRGAVLDDGFDVVDPPVPSNSVCFQQLRPTAYVSDPGEAVQSVSRAYRNKIWETVKVSSPYRKPYLYICPPTEQGARLPQMLSAYLLMFFLGSVTRYIPGYFEDLLESRYGPLIETFISESPMQFLYQMASDILGREVSKPAII